MVRYSWRGAFADADAEGFGHRLLDDAWNAPVERSGLGWVTAVDAGELVGFVNVAWDGGVHASLLDTLVRADRRREGIGTALVQAAVAGARGTGCEWPHVDVEDDLRGCYETGCGSTPTGAGLIALA
jgi:GNAT superfamily N-acetyltransferase